MRDVLSAVDEAFRLKGGGKTEMPAKIGVHSRPDAFIHAMPAYLGGSEAIGMKWVSGYPANPASGLPYISGLLILNNPHTGLPQAVMDCSWITAMRTGASAGISARHLADPKSRVVGILGCGVQNRMAVAALAEVLPLVEEVRCHDIFEPAMARYASEMGQRFPQLQFRRTGSPAEMIDGADVVVTAIPIVRHPKPPLDAGMLKPGAVAISLDYDAAWTGTAMKECRFYTDDVQQLLETRSHGHYFSGIPSHIDGDLGELVAGSKPGRTNLQERYFSMNLGIAVEDIATARVVMCRALELGLGFMLPL